MTGHTHDHGRGVLSQLAPEGRELKALIPGVYEGFAQLHTAAFAEGVLDKKTKELLALAIAIAVRCDGCICLLYTSPSPRDRQKSRMPSSA